MWTMSDDPLSDIAVASPRLTRQKPTGAVVSLAKGQRLQLHIEPTGWVQATLPIPATEATTAHIALYWKLLQAQQYLPGGVKFGRAPGSNTLILSGDLPLHPRSLIRARWQVMQQGFIQALDLLKQSRRSTSLSLTAEDTQPTTHPVALTEHMQTILHEGSWSWTTQHDETLVTVPLQEHVHLVTLQQLGPSGTLWCRLEHPLPVMLSAVCRQAIGAFLLESNTRLRLARFSLLDGDQYGVLAEVSLEPDRVNVVTLGQALDAVAVAAHLVWPVLPAFTTETIAQMYLQMCGVA
jgi:hypothetical protein